MEPSKYIFCAPRGGWNDILCQIGKCIEYANKTNRVLVVDTSLFSGIKDNLSNYFQLRSHVKNIFLSPSVQINEVFQMDETYVDYYNKHLNKVVSIDFNKHYEDKIILHTAPGGGLKSQICMDYFKLPAIISENINSKIISMNRDYHAVMIRNTDYKTDYKSLFDDIKSKIHGNNLLICTDDIECINYAKNFFTNKVFNFSNLPPVNTGKPLLLNAYKNSIDQKTLNYDAISDLFLASYATHIYPSYISTLFGEAVKSGTQSGFQKLAYYLNKNRELLHLILNFD